MNVRVFPNPSAHKVPARLRYKAVASPPWPVKSSLRELGIGYGSTKEAAKKRAVAEYKKKHSRRK